MDTAKVIFMWLADKATSVITWIGAAIGLIAVKFSGLPPMAQAVIVLQVSDMATGFACAWLGRSPKSESGRISSKAMWEGCVKKGVEWVVIWACSYAGAPLGMEGVSAMAMAAVVATELVSFIENLTLLGLDFQVLHTILDVAHGKSSVKKE